VINNLVVKNQGFVIQGHFARLEFTSHCLVVTRDRVPGPEGRESVQDMTFMYSYCERFTVLPARMGVPGNLIFR